MPVKGGRHTDRSRELISGAIKRRHAEERERVRVRTPHLRMIKAGHVPEHLRPLAAAVEARHAETMAALGGDDASPQIRRLAEIAATLDLLGGALALAFMQTQDPDLATRCGSLLKSCAAVLGMAGLHRVQRDVPALHEYLAARAKDRASAAITIEPESVDAPPAEAVDAAHGEVEADAGERQEEAG